jgi:hypothetical protein
METTSITTGQLLDQIAHLSGSWHGAGTLGGRVLKRIAFHAGGAIKASAETGAGKSTLLLSHLSGKHTVFALDCGGSLSAVRSSPLFNHETVEIVEGPTQKTLPTHVFREKLQLVLIDGPHGYPFPEMEYWHFYPHLEPGGLLIIDDMHIPTIYNLFAFLRDDVMFDLLEVVGTTAIFRRTDAPLFDPYGDAWWQQGYNKKRFPATFRQKIINLIPLSLQYRLVRLLGRG